MNLIYSKSAIMSTCVGVYQQNVSRKQLKKMAENFSFLYQDSFHFKFLLTLALFYKIVFLNFHCFLSATKLSNSVWTKNITSKGLLGTFCNIKKWETNQQIFAIEQFLLGSLCNIKKWKNNQQIFPTEQVLLASLCNIKK